MPSAPDQMPEPTEASAEAVAESVEGAAESRTETAAERAAEVLPQIKDRVSDVKKKGERVVAAAIDANDLPAEEVLDAKAAANLEPGLAGVHAAMDTAAAGAVSGIEAVAAASSETAAVSPEVVAAWQSSEQDYLGGNKDAANLKTRYEDERTEAAYVLGQISEFARSRGVESAPDLAGRPFDAEARQIIEQHLQTEVAAFFLNKENGSNNPAKYESVRLEVLRYVDLVDRARAEGDLPADLGADAVLEMARENVAALAMQDRVATENLLGDHGVRHLVDHNIRMCEGIMDQLEGHGQEVRAVDRLVLHQVMIDHDLGYAMDPVREGINEGKFGVDTGHNLLAAKFIRERATSQTGDPLKKVFSEEQIARIHRGILNHDSSSVRFILDNSEGARDANMESAIHLADNTHAFEDKLPEVLYGVPESLETMRLLKIAGETGDTGTTDLLKEKLVRQIQASDRFSEDDKTALAMAARSLQPASYKFAVPRICGNKPEFAVGGQGEVTISVQASAIHYETTKLFGQKELAQFQKFVKDLGGPKEIDPEASEIHAGTITVRLTRAQESTEVSDYQARLNSLVEKPAFRSLIEEDNELAGRQGVLEGVLARGDSEELARTAAAFGVSAGSETEAGLREVVENIKAARRQGLIGYIEPAQ